MAYIGKTPTPAPLTSSDITNGIVTGEKLNADVISSQTELATAPADTDEFLISDAGVLKRLDASLVGGGGITEADQWRVTATGTGTGVFTSNWERNDTSFSYIGTGMSESSGIFTFPSTGIYMIDFQASGKNNAQTDFVSYSIEATTNNSSYSAISTALNACNTGNSFCNLYQSVIFDVTDTTTHKVRFNHDEN